MSKVDERENVMLSAYASKSVNSKGRKHDESVHPYRSSYQRDRDRILHSASFRRLEYKTQVFIFHEGDYYRTRLTHSLEVAQIARTIARTLNLNEDLAEAIALAHDIGHTPFGHAGEDALNKLIQPDGFDHNLHGLRVVDELESRYVGFKGLNLTWEVREGMVRHSTKYDNAEDQDKIPKRLKEEFNFECFRRPSLEAQIVDKADEIAYDNHDLDDGLNSLMITTDELKSIALWEKAYSKTKKSFPEAREKIIKRLVVRELINGQVTDMIENSRVRLEELGLEGPDQVREIILGPGERIIDFSRELKTDRAELEDFLKEKLYNHYKVVRMIRKAKRFIEELFVEYTENEGRSMPDDFQKYVKKEGVKRVACDYIAGMTDRYALNEYRRLFDPAQKV